MRSAIAFLAMVLLVGFVWADSLTPCPDCARSVSPRAIMCPHCGCPGDAIKEATARRMLVKEPAPRLPVVRARTERSRGYAIACREGARHFVVLDANLLADATTLELVPLATNTPVAYQHMEIAGDVGLVRFNTPETNLLFLARASNPSGDASTAYWLMPDGQVLAGAPGTKAPVGALAAVDVHTNLVALLCRDVRASVLTPLPYMDAWREVAPNAFRQQLALLAKADKEATDGRVSAETARTLAETKWVSADLENCARHINQRPKEDRKP